MSSVRNIKVNNKGLENLSLRQFVAIKETKGVILSAPPLYKGSFPFHNSSLVTI